MGCALDLLRSGGGDRRRPASQVSRFVAARIATRLGIVCYWVEKVDFAVGWALPRANGLELLMIGRLELLQMQRDQYVHDLRNHFDILSLHKADRLKHYGLHYAKYVGRLARDSQEPKPVARTVTDAFLVNLSAASTLSQDLSKELRSGMQFQPQGDEFRVLADAVGRFADACEKIDHLEEFLAIALTANGDILNWILAFGAKRDLDLQAAIKSRRKELADRHFFIMD